MSITTQSTDGLKDRIGTIGNQFALTTIFAFLFSVPLAVWREGSRWAEFCTAWKTNPAIKLNMIMSGLWFYGYNELATMTLKKTGPVTQSVANTAKRVIVIVGVAIVMGESLDPLKVGSLSATPQPVAHVIQPNRSRTL